MGVRRLYALFRAITTDTSAPASTGPKPQSDVGAIRRMMPVKYTPKKEAKEE